MSIRIAAVEVSHWHALEDHAYLRHLYRMPGVELVGLQDPDEAVARRKGAEVGSPPTFRTVEEMLVQAAPDFVVAMGRHRVMAGIAHLLLDRGIPFIMEKPMGLSADEVLGVAEKAEAVDGFAAVPLAQRCAPFARYAREMMSAGRFGPVSHFAMRMNRPTSDRYVHWDSPWMLDPAESGGGCLRNLGIHAIDLFLTLTGEEARVTGAEVSARGLGRPVEDYAAVLLRSAGGIRATVEVGNLFPYIPGRDRPAWTDTGFKICGRDALLAYGDGVIRVITAGGEETIPAVPEVHPARTVLRENLDRWQRGEKPMADARDCWRAIALVDEAYAIAGGAGGSR